MSVRFNSTPINKNWQFKQQDCKDSEFRPVSQFPTNIHLDLIHHGIIADPFLSKNELDVQWVGEKAWVYKTTFSVPTLAKDKGEIAVLSFDGLDTYAAVKLNGKEILKTTNMFLPERVIVSDLLNESLDNELVITFDSAYLIGKKLEETHSEHYFGCWNGDKSRLAVRKAQYHYGWDWGPTLLTAGPWRSIYLETFSSRISDLYFTTEIPEDLCEAIVAAKVNIEGWATVVKFDLSLRGSSVASTAVHAKGGTAEASFTLKNPELWYPVRYGNQPLYSLTAVLLDGDQEIDAKTKKLGIRKARVVQRPLMEEEGTSFFFEINNIPVWCGGSNWIPADSFIPRVTTERYRNWLELLAYGHQIMVRVWGGGIYEEDAFYDICDEIGILVWQDFAFGCGNYPAFPEFLNSVKKEAIANVKRLRHHPSIVIFAGNNEDYQYMESENLEYNPNDQNPENWLKTNFPARYIYEKVLVDVMKEYLPATFYHFGSPYGGKDTRDPTVGDIHQWNVWHQAQEKYQNFDKLGGRFVSEFGMQAFPDIRTIDSYLPKNSTERYPQSSAIDFHNKATGHERRIALYLVENIQYTFSPIEQYIYCTQLMQAECLSSAYRLWRRQWKGTGREYISGALVWQINDCWPVTSWSIIDYYLRPKYSYYAIKRELEPITIAMKRVEILHPRDKYTRVYIKKEHRLQIWASSFLLKDIQNVKLTIAAFNVITGNKIYSSTVKEGITLRGNISVEIANIQLMGVDDHGNGPEDVVVAAYLADLNGKPLARRIGWADPLKYVKLQKPRELKYILQDGIISVSAEVPVKGLAFECHLDGVFFEDNCIDLVPGETVAVGVKGLKDGEQGKLGVRYLGMI